MECSTGPRLRNPERESRQSENTRGENPSAPLKAYVEIVEHVGRNRLHSRRDRAAILPLLTAP
jgi:hypothetical protein